jgi:hypothetical protein
MSDPREEMTMTTRDLRLAIVLAATLLVLSACQTLLRESVPGEWVEIPAGSTLTLHQPVRIPPGRTRAGLTSSQARGVASEGTSCVIEVRRLDQESSQLVAAGRYRITRVQDYVALVSGLMPDTDARTIRFQLASHGDSGGSQMVRFGYHFWLDDGQDPNLMRMTCLGRLDDPAATRPPTLAEIRALLGELGTLELGTD